MSHMPDPKSIIYVGIERGKGYKFEIGMPEPPLVQVSHGHMSVQSAWRDAFSTLLLELAKQVADQQTPGMEELAT